VLTAGANWRHNLRGEADVRVTPEGRERAAHAVVGHDPDRAARTLEEMSGNLGRAFSVKINMNRPPTVAEIKPMLDRRGVAPETQSLMPDLPRSGR